MIQEFSKVVFSDKHRWLASELTFQKVATAVQFVQYVGQNVTAS